jgi:hypothetical protein
MCDMRLHRQQAKTKARPGWCVRESRRPADQPNAGTPASDATFGGMPFRAMAKICITALERADVDQVGRRSR